jgi:hypothetical protein
MELKAMKLKQKSRQDAGCCFFFIGILTDKVLDLGDFISAVPSFNIGGDNHYGYHKDKIATFNFAGNPVKLN